MSLSLDHDRLIAALRDRYAITGTVGSGGMATVFEAEDLKHHRRVAVKVLRPEISGAMGPERFLREIQIIAQFQHPHVLPLYDSGEADEFLYYVMPLVQGESLRDRLNRERQLPMSDALSIARQVAAALAYAHKHDVVHRDIKPENILLSGGEAVVADFGIARALSAAGGTKLTETGVIIGTPWYMSPEQATGDEVDGRSDIYALGCVAYEMLAGQPPFIGPTTESVIHQHISGVIPSPAAIRESIPPLVVATLSRALAKTPADRFATAEEFAGELELASAQARLSTSHVTPLPRSAEPPSRGARLLSSTRQVTLVGAALVVVGLGAVGVARFMGRTDAVTARGIRLTVLPFENLGPADDEYFAAGMTEEVTARLARVNELSIIARQSAVQYKQTDKTAQQIGRELEVDYLLEATISWQRGGSGPSRVRVRPQLIRTADASHVWADVYDEDLTEVFAVQTNVATRVVEALGLALLEPARRSIEQRPTSNLEAYDYYLRGNSYLDRSPSIDNLRSAGDVYVRALALDPRFALAAAKLSMTNSRMYWYYWDRSDARANQARRMADSALTLDPELPEARLALGEYHYRAHLDYRSALREYDIAIAQRPNDAGILENIAYIERRQGEFGAAARRLTRALEIEPRSVGLAEQLALTQFLTREYGAAQRLLEQNRSLAPDQIRPVVWLAMVHVTARGDTAAARGLLGETQRIAPAEADAQEWWHAGLWRIAHGVNERTFSTIGAMEFTPGFRHIALADLATLSGQGDRARAHYDSARVLLERDVARRPDEARFHSEVGVAYAGLGRAEAAVRAASRAVELTPVTRDAVLGPDWVRNLAQVYMMLGMRDEAVAELERWLAMPSWGSSHWLRLDPLWTPLRDHPRFQRLIGRR